VINTKPHDEMRELARENTSHTIIDDFIMFWLDVDNEIDEECFWESNEENIIWEHYNPNTTR
jgi:hypothetical protein